MLLLKTLWHMVNTQWSFNGFLQGTIQAWPASDSFHVFLLIFFYKVFCVHRHIFILYYTSFIKYIYKACKGMFGFSPMTARLWIPPSGNSLNVSVRCLESHTRLRVVLKEVFQSNWDLKSSNQSYIYNQLADC